MKRLLVAVWAVIAAPCMAELITYDTLEPTPILSPLPLGIEVDPRCCGTEPVRNADGTIYRSYKALAQFRRMNPCPVTGLTTGSCPDWQVDHVVPLANGGCDMPFNMQWLPVQIKTCAGLLCKDRFERKIYSCALYGLL